MSAPTIAYFSMEIALDAAMPTYCGGLGILAGDTIRSAADLEVPLCAVSLVYRKGYFRQSLDEEGRQIEEAQPWDPGERLEEQAARVTVVVEGTPVALRAWKHEVTGVSGHCIPVFLLDADLPENSEFHRTLTDRLYLGDAYHRLCQELILGAGGVRMLRALGFDRLEKFHMNEGHAALLTLELLRETATAAGRDRIVRQDVEVVRQKCVFTTHTPVPAGHDHFPMPMVQDVIGRQTNFLDMQELFCPDLAGRVVRRDDWGDVCANIFSGENHLHMTYLALIMSHYVNGVAKKHAEVSQLMYAEYQIDAITNGVHAATWTSPSFRRLFDHHMPGWEEDNFSLRYALKISEDEIWLAHQEAKARLIAHVNEATGAGFDVQPFTLGFARRSTRYKRSYLLFTDPQRLRSLAKRYGTLQVVYSGKAHPGDSDGSALIQQVTKMAGSLGAEVKVVYLPDYGIDLAKLLTAGVDLWLNTPLPPLEASGTSGMKAAMNGVPSLSILDGWWIEGCIEGVTGWAIDDAKNAPRSGDPRDAHDANALYAKLEVILEQYRHERPGFIQTMRSAIALNGSFFNTQRMVQQYALKAYLH